VAPGVRAAPPRGNGPPAPPLPTSTSAVAQSGRVSSHGGGRLSISRTPNASQMELNGG